MLEHYWHFIQNTKVSFYVALDMLLMHERLPKVTKTPCHSTILGPAVCRPIKALIWMRKLVEFCQFFARNDANLILLCLWHFRQGIFGVAPQYIAENRVA